MAGSRMIIPHVSRKQVVHEIHQGSSKAQAKCPIIHVEVPVQPLHTFGADLFHYVGSWFLLVTDAYSKAPFIRRVANTGAYASIKEMKSIFSKNGIPSKAQCQKGAIPRS